MQEVQVLLAKEVDSLQVFSLTIQCTCNKAMENLTYNL